MLPLANKPIMEHLVTECLNAGISEFIFIVGYKDSVVREYFGDGAKWNAKISYLLQQKALGTANAVGLTQDSVGEKFLVMNGDIILQRADILKLADSTGITMAVKEVADVTGLGVVQTLNGEITHIFEKPTQAISRLANTGAYLLTRDIFQAISNTEESPRGQAELTRSLEILIEHGEKIKCQTIDYWLNLTYPWDLIGANETLLAGISPQCDGIIEEGVHIVGPCVVGSNTRIRSGAYIVGPVLIGRNCDIGPNCFLRSSTSIGDSCHIGASVEIKNSIIMAGTKIPHQSYIGDSVIGESCNLGAGTKVANLRFDHRNVRIGSFDTHRRKLGAIIGDQVQTGVNTTINAGSTIGDNAFIWPGVTINGNIGPGARVISQNEYNPSKKANPA